ncbi:MAG: M15 family metallopeptidase [Kofleriaceae bacterium]|jgi:hypothetical protein|nr:M15 family metallopeptidase [Kofleriaceae bacterium]MBP9172116.1 M15 family metallopeptidase [Kofleriaceae bacterium]MBP9859567.1 M15 family metallopeptidase [Kofleriaceae bacterium]
MSPRTPSVIVAAIGALISSARADDDLVGGPQGSRGLTVAEVARTQCTAVAVRPLSDQVLAEMMCLRPGALAAIDDLPGVALGANASPVLNAAAARALRAAADGSPLWLYSTTRTVAQQYVYHAWYRSRTCCEVVTLAAAPGSSNHESGLAIDVPDHSAWRDRLTARGFRWFGRRDVVHFDYRGRGKIDLRRLGVRAFQRLWNRNHPDDRIREHGRWDAATARRMARAPADGFPLGPDCR